MKIIKLLLIASIFLFIRYTEYSAPPIIIEKIDRLTLDKDILVNNNWSNLSKLHEWGYKISFSKDNEFTIEVIGEGGDVSGGKFLVKDNIVTLTWENHHSGKETKRILCYLTFVTDDPFYTQALECSDKISYYQSSSLKKTGSEITIFKTKAILVLEKKMVAKSNVKLREYPNRSARVSECISYHHGENKLSYLPAGTSVIIYARTLKMETIDEKSEYWYFVRHLIDGYCTYSNGESTPTGWVFGAYIE